MTEEQLFINIINDLEQRVKDNTPYDLVKAAGLIRQLFIDNGCLFHELNKKYRLKVKFKIADTPTPSPNTITLLPLCPNQFYNTIEVKLEKLLSKEVFSNMIYNYTVRDVIKYAANKRGGVHLDQYKTEKEKYYNKLIENGPKISYKGMKNTEDIGLAFITEIYRVLKPSISEIVKNIS